jgi:hypothetical protein
VNSSNQQMLAATTEYGSEFAGASLNKHVRELNEGRVSGRAKPAMNSDKGRKRIFRLAGFDVRNRR